MEDWKKYTLNEDQRIVVESLSDILNEPPNDIVQSIFELGMMTAVATKQDRGGEFIKDIRSEKGVQPLIDAIHEGWLAGAED